MKVIYTHQEVVRMIADKHNIVCLSDVEISDLPINPPAYVPDPVSRLASLGSEEIVRQLAIIVENAKRDGYNEGRRVGDASYQPSNWGGKIGMIKAYRTLTNFGLKEAKDAVENALLPF